MKEPYLADDAFLADVAAVKGQARLHIWWLGQSGFLLSDGGVFVLVDPYLSDSLTTKYANTDKPHVRMTRRVIDPHRLGFISVLTSSHNHTDHLDAETIKPLLEVNPGLKVVAPEANRAFVAERLGIDPGALVGIRDGQAKLCKEWEFIGVPAAHETIERDEMGRCKCLGYVIRIGPHTVYHSGDTVLYNGMVEHLRGMDVTVALLPINGRAPERRVAGNLNGREAARLAKQIGARQVIPCHYDMFGFNTAAPDEFMAECERLGQPCKVLRAGERLTWDKDTLGQRVSRG